jgi:hypothetical protein
MEQLKKQYMNDGKNNIEKNFITYVNSNILYFNYKLVIT